MKKKISEKKEHLELFKIFELMKNNEKKEPTLEMLDNYQKSEIELLKLNDLVQKDIKDIPLRMRIKANKIVQFHSYLHRTVLFHFSKRFTYGQWSCLFQFFNTRFIDYTGMSAMSHRDVFLDYIDLEEQKTYDLGDVESFKKFIQSISHIEFDIIVNFIVEKWNTCTDWNSLFQELAKD